MNYRVPIVIKLIPLFLLITTGLQLVLYDFSWYTKALTMYIMNFHSYGVWINLFALYFSRKFCNSIITDISIIGLILMNIFSNIVFIIVQGDFISFENVNFFIMVWDTFITAFTITSILIVWYFKRQSNYSLI